MKFLLALLALITGVSSSDAVRAAEPVAAERGVAATPVADVQAAEQVAVALFVAALPEKAPVSALLYDARTFAALPVATVYRSDRARE